MSSFVLFSILRNLFYLINQARIKRTSKALRHKSFRVKQSPLFDKIVRKAGEHSLLIKERHLFCFLKNGDVNLPSSLFTLSPKQDIYIFRPYAWTDFPAI